MMPRVLRALVFIVAASLLVAAAGKFRFLEVLGWSVFFSGLYWSSSQRGRRIRCQL